MITDKMLIAAVKAAIEVELVFKYGGEEAYLKAWQGVKRILEASADAQDGGEVIKEYLPITHKEAWDNVNEWVLATEPKGVEVVFSPEGGLDAIAGELFDAKQWYRVKAYRAVGLLEAYRVLQRGGEVFHKGCGEGAYLVEGTLWWKNSFSSVSVRADTLSGWAVLSEGLDEEGSSMIPSVRA